jgi:hypothetical protein
MGYRCLISVLRPTVGEAIMITASRLSVILARIWWINWRDFSAEPPIQEVL